MKDVIFASRKQKEELKNLLLEILREDPDHYGIVVDEWGFIGLEQLRLATRMLCNWATGEQIDQLITDESLFENYSDRIRARNGHRYFIRPQPEPVTSPSKLYHGLPQLLLSSVIKYGLKPLGTRYIYLAETADEAWYQGIKLNASPTIVMVLAQQAQQAGVQFYKSERDYLCENIPPRFISVKI